MATRTQRPRSTGSRREPGYDVMIPAAPRHRGLASGIAGDIPVPWPLLPPREVENTAFFVKRLLDVTLGLILLLLSLPILAVSSLLIKLTSPGPVFFRHTRKGLGEEEIEVIKLRTMEVGAEAMIAEVAEASSGPVFTTVRRDPRVTPVGRLLRSLSIDELPQLVNVLRGEMSLVGPRPLVEEEVERLPPVHRCVRARMKPGLTCLWQISGRNDCTDGERLTLDQRYLDDWSIWLDVKVLLWTIPAVISGRGAE